MSAHERAVEAAEIVNRLNASDLRPLVRALANEPHRFMFASGRINCSAVARHLRVNAADVVKMIEKARGVAGGF